MDFIVENYVWFVVGGIIILMAIIGYYADKTDFGRIKREVKPKKEVLEKEEKPKKEKKKKSKSKKEEVTEENIVEAALEDIAEASEEPVLENNNTEDLFQTLEPNFDAPLNEEVDESLFAPLTEDNLETTQDVVEEQTQDTPIGDISEYMNPEVEANFELNNVEPVTLPEENNNYNATEESATDLNVNIEQPVAEDDDVWKF